MGKLKMRKPMKHITITVIYPGHALNRDEKIGGNILSIKKLTKGGEVYSFISRSAIRHYIFQTLVRAHQGKPPWEPAPVIESGTGGKKVVQFDLSRASILTHAELDVFGYMATFGKGESAVTRKSIIGITKAVSLEPYMGDMAFYANHDLVERSLREGGSATPNPFSREEHTAYYKVSFVIDVDRLGREEHIVDSEPSVGETSGEGEVKVHKLEGKKHKVSYRLFSDSRKKRLLDLLEVLHDGIIAQTSGEANTLIPIAFAAAFVKVPVVLLDPYIYWPPIPVEGSRDALFPLNPAAVRNSWYIKKSANGGLWCEGIYGAGQLIPPEEIKGEMLESWEGFIQRVEAIYDSNEGEAS